MDVRNLETRILSWNFNLFSVTLRREHDVIDKIIAELEPHVNRDRTMCTKMAIPSPDLNLTPLAAFLRFLPSARQKT